MTDLVAENDVIESEPKLQICASATENGMSNKCCMTSGTTCWRISVTAARSSKFCWVDQPGYALMPAYMTKDNSIFCHGVHAVRKGTGITEEKDFAILSAQFKLPMCFGKLEVDASVKFIASLLLDVNDGPYGQQELKGKIMTTPIISGCTFPLRLPALLVNLGHPVVHGRREVAPTATTMVPYWRAVVQAR
eukprot:CAMPEP_0172799358 /NCGR_PEP_ID=MMETSP1075-20121228/1828_1 /TAXON_ID=2916 /ORGANISM="Ceratium fusus, Strain PA161109" /LENGTH=191 /DNA_ID=CAMNT_0013637031 /DNA_START=32 /DNA_END=607 /DNA_ORIENTATION=+